MTGCAGYVASLTPTLLPRTNFTQALASSVTAVAGYAIGAIGEAVVRAVSDRVRRGRSLPARPQRISTKWRLVITGGLVVIAAAFTPWAVSTQVSQRTEMQVPGSAPSTPMAIILSAVLFVVLLCVGRGVRRLTGRISRRFGRRGWNAVAADGTAVVIVIVGFAVIVGAAYGGSLIIFNRMNNAQPAAQVQPTSPLRSSGPGSPISWQSLGVQGRWFVSEGPTAAQISAVTGRPALEPIRTYAGIETNGEAKARAQQAVDDLVRAGGLNRDRIVVYTPSTNGYVDATASAAAEYVADGNVASVSMQYTILPSALSMVLDTAQSLDAGRYLLSAVTAAVDKLPAAKRPKLYVYGESLGAYGSLAPFDGVGVEGFHRLVTGAVWAGPPANSAYWEQLNAQATAGPTWQPIVANGSVIRYAANAAGLDQPDAPWGQARGVFLQNATDPVVWWSPGLLFHRPGWLDEPRGPGVPAEMRWLPLVTYWQVFVDMPAAGGMPAGVGHNYEPSIGPAWTAVMQPAGWGSEQETRLQTALKGAANH